MIVQPEFEYFENITSFALHPYLGSMSKRTPKSRNDFIVLAAAADLGTVFGDCLEEDIESGCFTVDSGCFDAESVCFGTESG